jgi:hypothetical protein
MISICVKVELLAIMALIVGVPVPVAATVALLAATPATAITIWSLLNAEQSLHGVVDILFLFITWALLPCLLALHGTYGVDGNLFRLIVVSRIFAAITILNRGATKRDINYRRKRFR